MPQPTKQQWLDYIVPLHQYINDVEDYVDNGDLEKSPPQPPQPPTFTGWGWQTNENNLRAWQQFVGLLDTYWTDINTWVESFVDGGENPNRPLPPKPPQFSGWA